MSDGKFKKQQELLKLAQELSLTENQTLAIQERILNNQIKSVAALDKQAAAMDKKISKLDIQEAKEANLLKIETDIRDLGEEITKIAGNISDTKQEELTATKNLIKEAKKQLQENISLGLVQEDIAQHLTDELALRENALKVAVDSQKIGAPYADALGQGMDAAKSSVDDFLGSLPGGDALKNMLGFDEAFDSLKAGAKAAMGAVVQSLIAGQGPMAALKAGQAAFNATAMMNPYVLIAAAVLVVIGLIAQQNKLIQEQAKAQGVSLAAARQQVMEAKKQVAAGKTILANTQDILAVQNEVNNALGSSIVMNAENAAQVADVGKAMGYGAEMAAKSSAAMIQMGVAAADVAEVQMETNLMAVKAGVDMGKVQADIAENAGKTAKFFGGNVKALQKAAIEAAKMGVSLETMASVSDKLLDFETSITKQFEFQALTGRSLNLDLARNLALQGDIAGATKEIMNQVGTIHDFNSLDVIERQALADAAGMEVEELQKSLQLQAIRGDMTDEELARAQGLNLSAAELKDLTADELKQKLASQDATAKMAATMNQFKEIGMEALQPIMDIVSALMNVISPIMKLQNAITKFVLAPLQLIFGIIDGLMAAIQPIFDIFNELGSVLGGTGGLGEMFKQIGNVIGNVIFAPIKAIATFIKGVLSPVIAVIKDIFNSVGEVIGTITDALGGGGGGGLMGIFETIGNVIGTLISIPLKIIGFIIKSIIVPAVEFLLIPFQFIADIIAAIGDAIDTYLIQPIEKAVELLSYLNPANWFGGGDDAEVEVTADGEALESAGSVDDGVIQNGKIISTNPQDTLVATKDPEGLFGSGSPGDVAKGLFSMTPMGMAANAIGGLFGGGDDSSAGSTDNQAMLAKLDEVIAAIQGMEIKMDGSKVGSVARVAGSFRRG